MKHNKIFLLLASILLTFVLVLAVSAADSTVIYRGLEKGFDFQPGSEYTDTDLFDNFKGVMPGDELTETIKVQNKASDSDYIKVYIRAEVHDEEDNPLSEKVAEHETVASMQDFLAQLHMTVKNGREVIYEASPDQLDGFANPVYLGTIRANETIKLDVTLNVPIELGNEYAYRVGEVDWVFLIEAFNDPVIPDKPQNVIVNKVWNDDGIGRPASITVHLLRAGEVYDTVQLTEKNNWSYAWSNLERRYEWSVVEEVPDGYVASYKKNASGWVTTITNTKILADRLTVEKVWDDGNSADRPDFVDVVLLCDGEYYAETELNAGNDWTYTWENLSVNSSWSVVEKKVPEGYYVSYSYDAEENKIIVTNALEEPEAAELTVNKVWQDDGADRPEAITVYLLRDGELADTVEITADMNWTYTWEELPAGYSWSVVEGNVPGYTTEYAVDGTVVTVTNTKMIEKVPYDLTVKKVWSDRGTGRPDKAEVVLYNGETAVEAVLLGEWNNWTYTWKNLDGAGNWRVTEDNIPKGYTPSYEVADGVVTITNTEILLQTGQLNWPIPVFGGLGLIILGIGILLLRKKKENDHA